MNTSKKSVLAIAMCISVFGCKKADIKSDEKSNNIDFPKYRFSQDGGDSDDPPIVITQVNNTEGVGISSASVLFINDKDSVCGYSDEDGNCVVYLGQYSSWNLQISCAGYETKSIHGIPITDSLVYLSETLLNAD